MCVLIDTSASTSIFGLSFTNTAAGFLRGNLLVFTRQCCLHRNFPFSTGVIHGVFEFVHHLVQ